MDCFAALAMTERHGLLRGARRQAMTGSARSSVIACDKREAFAQGSAATKQSSLSLRGEMDCFAALAMTERHGLLRRGACQGRATRWLAMTGSARSSVIACDKREAFA